MALAKRARPVRRKKKPATASKNTVPKRRDLRVGKSKARASHRGSKTAEDKLVRRFHELVEKELQGIATSRDLSELEQIKAAMRKIEIACTAQFETVLEQRHVGIMKKLDGLTDELRRFSPLAQR